MLVRDVNPYPIRLVINFWEYSNAQLGTKLDELLCLGLTHIASFVPWQLIESDISRSLNRFLQAVSERRMALSLVITPDVGVYYPYSGLPKDLASSSESEAKQRAGDPFCVLLPPNAFCLPSLHSSHFLTRYHSYLTRLDSLLSEISKAHPKLLERVRIVLTGSFWKYYRSHYASSSRAFEGEARDFSHCSSLLFREYLERNYAQKEFAELESAEPNRWKSKFLEKTNYDLFSEYAEQMFKVRTAQFVKRKAYTVDCVELYTPEADPAYSYTYLFQTLLNARGNLKLFSSLLSQMAVRKTKYGEDDSLPFIYWNALGGFKNLTEIEKQFLILKSILLMGSQGGGIFLNESEWFSFSSPFRQRVENLAKLMSQGELSIKTRALYLTPHLWSVKHPLYYELVRILGVETRVISQIEMLSAMSKTMFLIVDPAFIITKKILDELLQWAQAGRVLALPRSSLYTSFAKGLLEHLLAQNSSMEFNLGLTYHVCPLKEGKLVLYDYPEKIHMQGESLQALRNFIKSLLSLAHIEDYCHFNDGRIEMIPLKFNENSMSVFVLNDSAKKIDSELFFNHSVYISDFFNALSSQHDRESLLHENAERFELCIPPCGVLPLLIEGIESLDEAHILASQDAEFIKNSVHISAINELPGITELEGTKSPWN
ncbi:MAG: hypothetical protein HY072_05035 [Deltaproteobacteria bacterium]|nr:hypothetical protein [Deltaproteobacteria bacterium]